MDKRTIERAEAWTRPPFDETTAVEARRLVDEARATEDGATLTELFGLDLAFGTGGLRGVMGVGTNRMNAYTVGRATQGVANYVLASGSATSPMAVVGYDSRRNSREFACETARVFAANGLKTFLFEALRPTPMLSFATMHFFATVGVMVTASHNPPEYNGYKLYWGNGQQVIGKVADDIIAGVNATEFAAIRRGDFDRLLDDGMIEWVGGDFDEIYVDALAQACLSPGLCHKHGSDLKIVFTALHGTGGTVVPRALSEWGFHEVSGVASQNAPDGNFPTVASPNPEERAALARAIEMAEVEGADLVLGTDPDADRVGVAVPGPDGRQVLLNGNDTAVLLCYYEIERRRELERLASNSAVIKTIVTTELVRLIAESYRVTCYDVLTGFKYIGELINQWDDNGTQEMPTTEYLFGGEESYGYLIGRHTRDKDAVVACCVVAEVAAWAREKGMTLYRLLDSIHAKFGVFREGQLSKTLKGMKGMEQIAAIMERLRSDPPREMLGVKLSRIVDVMAGTARTVGTDAVSALELPRENVVQLFYGDTLKITGRPSGTEPKIKFYIAASHRSGLPLEVEALAAVREGLEGSIERAKSSLDTLIAGVIGT